MVTQKTTTIKTSKVRVTTVKQQRKTRSKLTFPQALTALMDKKYEYAKLSYWPDKKYIFIQFFIIFINIIYINIA